MFAPYCPTCQSRVLLGTRRIVRFDLDDVDRRELVLRCHCGTDLDWDADATPAEAAVDSQPVVVAAGTHRTADAGHV